SEDLDRRGGYEPDSPRVGSGGGPGGVEDEADGVDAVAGALGGEALTVEPVAEVGVAVGPAHLGAHHTERAVLQVAHGARERLVERRPAAVRVELGVAGEQRRATGPAPVGARRLGLHVLAGPGPLGAALSEHPELLRVQADPPFLLGQFHVTNGTAAQGAPMRCSRLNRAPLLRLEPEQGALVRCSRLSRAPLIRLEPEQGAPAQTGAPALPLPAGAKAGYA